MANVQLAQGQARVLDRIETLVQGMALLGLGAPTSLLAAGSKLSRGMFAEAAEAHREFLNLAVKAQGGNPAGPFVVDYATETQAYLAVLVAWDGELEPAPQYGHNPEAIVRQLDANKWNMDYSTNTHLFGMTVGHTEVGLEFYNDWWTGVGHSKHEGLMRDFHMVDCHIRDNKKWSSRANRIQEDVTFTRCTWERNRDEHFIYHNVAGFGPGVTQEEANERVCLGVYGCLFDDCDSQGIQIVSADGRAHETPDPAYDDTPAGRIEVHDSLFRRTGQGVHNGNQSSRPSFTLSFFPGKSIISLHNVVVDNSMLPKSTGALLVQRQPKLHAFDCSFDFPDGDRSLAKIEEVPEVLISGGRWWGSRPVNVNDCGKVRIEGVESNVDLYVDGKWTGPLSDGYSSN